MKKLIGFLSVAFLIVLTVAGTARADLITVPLEDFLIFSGGGWVSDTQPGDGGDAGFETQIAGASLYIGNIGSNWDLTIGASETQVLGSVYVGRNFKMQAPAEIGTDGSPSFNLETPLGSAPGVYDPLDVAVVANTGTFENSNALIYGTLDLAGGAPSPAPGGTYTSNYTSTADTFARISMPGTSFVHTGGTDILVTGGSETTIDPGHYGDLTSSPGDPTILLYSGAGDYFFDSINTVGKKVTLKIDLSSGAPINIYTVGEMNFGGQDNELLVRGPGMGVDEYVLISDPSVRYLATLINWETRDTFTLGGGEDNTNYDSSTGWGSIWGGIVYSSLLDGVGVDIKQHIDWYGALAAGDTIQLLDHSRYNDVSVSIPDASSMLLLCSSLIYLLGFRRKLKR